MDTKNIKTPVFVGIIVVVVLVVGYFMWQNSGSAEPVPGPGQTLQNPFGNNPPKGGGARGAGGQAMTPPVPGTVGPQGFGPSKNAPIPR